MNNFDKSFELLIGHEGGFTDDRRDRGNWDTGKIGVGNLKGTKYGVSAMSYPKVDIKNLTLAQAKAIYRRDFWVAVKADTLPAGIDYLCFDIAVNHGVGDGNRFLQMAIGVKADGVIGPVTLAKVNAKPVVETIKAIGVVRQMDYSKIGTFKTYGLGWTRRNFDSIFTALGMAEPANDNVPLDQSKTISNNEPQLRAWGLFRKTR